MLRGADISVVQGHVDFDRLKADGLDFVILKGVEGNAQPGLDPMWKANLAAATKAGLLVSTYHFPYPLLSDGAPNHAGRSPKEQAQHWFDQTGGHGSQDGELPPAIDIEWPAPQNWGKWSVTAASVRQWSYDCIGFMTDLWGCLPLVYTYSDFWTHMGGALETGFAKCPLWMAWYPKPYAWPGPNESPIIPKPWTSWAFWQFSGGTMKLPAGAPVDYDVFAGDRSALEALAVACI